MSTAAIWHYDRPLAITIVGLAVLGTLVVASAGISLGGETWSLLNQRLLHLLVALTVGLVIWRVPLWFWQRVGWLGIIGAAGLLLLPLLLGAEDRGAVRWISLGGLSLQPSEPAKLLFILYFAGWCATYQQAARESTTRLIPLGVVSAIMVLLLYLQSDHGGMGILLATGFGVLFLSGVRFWIVLMLAAIVAGLMLILLYVADDYVASRFTSFTDIHRDPVGANYQIRQALIAHALGGWFGAGFGLGLQKQLYLPDAHTDFIFSVFVEEFGAIAGVVLVLVLFWLVLRIFWIGRRAENSGLFFGSYAAYGIAMLLGVQLTMNLGGSLGVLPVKGLTLIFFSHGGSSLLVLGGMMGLVLRIDADTRALKKSGRLR